MTRSHTVKKVLPGQPGTKKLVEKYGQRRLKTIEIIVEEETRISIHAVAKAECARGKFSNR